MSYIYILVLLYITLFCWPKWPEFVAVLQLSTPNQILLGWLGKERHLIIKYTFYFSLEQEV